jgi:REP element-mobilizing transposase RayT
MIDKPLTDQQQKVLEAIESLSSEQGFPPTLREIGQRVGLANVNAVRGHVAALEKKGYIGRDADKARSITVLHNPSALSHLKRKLHEVFRTNEGVLHRLVYGLALPTWHRTPHFTGPRLAWIEEVIDREVVEHGWTLLEKRIEPDAIVLVLAVWPNHSPEQVVRRLQTAGRVMWHLRPGKFEGKHLWGRGYVATTDLTLLDELAGQLCAGQPTS